MGKKRIGIVIALDGEREYTKAVRNAAAELRTLQSEGKLLKEQFSGQANSLKALQEKYKNLQSVLDKQKQKQRAIEDGLKNASQSYEKQGRNVHTLSREYESANKKLEKMKNASGTTKKALEQQEKTVNELAEALKKGQENQQAWSNKMQSWQTKSHSSKAAIEKLNKEIAQTAGYLKEAERATDKCATSIDGYGRKTKIAEKEAKKLNESMDALAGALIAGGVKEGLDAVKDALMSCVDAAAAFESSIAKVETIADTTDISLDNLKGQIVELSENTGEAAGNIADLAYDVISATGDTVNSVKLAGDAAKLATAGFTSSSSALSVLTTTINSYKMSADEATNISDSLVQTQNLGVLTIDKLSGSMGKAIATASAYNVNLYNVESGYVSLTKAGIGVEEATTYIAGMFSELGKAGSKVAVTLEEETGKSFGQLMKDGYSVADVLEILYESVNKDAEALMNLWSSQEAGKASNAIINQGITEFNENLGKLQNSVGATDKAYQKIADTSEYAKNKMLNSVNNLKIAIGTELNNELKGLYKSGAKAFDWATDFVKKNPWVVSAIEGLTVAVTMLGGAFAALAILPKITAMVKAFNAAMNANPFFLVATAIAAVTVAVVSYGKKIDESLDTTRAYREELERQREEIDNNIKSHAEAMESTQAECEANQMLVDKLYELNDVQEKTSGQKALMKSIVEQLKETIPELAGAFDEETGSINMSKEAIDALIEKQREYAMIDAASEAMKGFAKDAADAQIAARGIEDEIDSLKAQMADLGYDYDTDSMIGRYDLVEDEAMIRSLAKQTDELEKQKAAYEDTCNTAVENMNTAAEVQAEWSSAIDETSASADGLADAEEGAAASTETAAAVMSEAMTKLKESIADSIRSSISMFEEFSGGTEISADKIIGNLNSQIDGISGWADNMQMLAGAAGEGMTAEFYAYLAEMGPESANMIQELVNTLENDTGKFAEICSKWTDAMALDGMSAEIATGFEAAKKETARQQEAWEIEFEKMTGETYKGGMDAGFDVITEGIAKNTVAAEEGGRAVAESQAAGMTAGKPSVDNASQGIVDDVNSKLGEMPQQAYENGAYIPQGVANGINAGKQSAIQAAEALANDVNNAFKSNLQIKSPSRVFAKNGNFIAQGVAQGIKQAKSKAEDSVRDMCSSLVSAAKSELDIHSPSKKFKKDVGAQITNGIAAGITGESSGAVKAMRETAERLYAEAINVIGQQAGKKNPDVAALARAEAQLDQAKELQKQAERIQKEELNAHSKTVYKAAQSWLSAYKRTNKVTLEEEKYFWKQIKDTTAKGTEGYTKAIGKIEKIEKFEKTVKEKVKKAFNVSEYTTGKNGEKEKKSAEDYYSELYQAASKYFGNYSVLHNVSLQEQEYYWQQVLKKMKKGTQGYIDATKQLKTVQSEIKKQTEQEKESDRQYALSGGALETYKTYYDVSAKAEVQYWDIVRKKFKKGTKERIEADQKYYEAKENYNDKLEALNQEYYENVKEVNDKLADDIQDLTDAYNDAVAERKDAIYSSFGLFDEFKSESASGQTLLYNLKTQVAGIADWEQQLQTLGKKGILSEGLLKELQEMGPGASASIHALNQLSSEELAEYNKLWEQKNALAESQAVKENETLRKETQAQINELKKQAKDEIAAYKEEYDAAVKDLKKSIEAPLKDLAKKATEIGEDAAANLVAAIKDGATKKSTTADLQSVNTKISKELGKLPKAGKTVGDNTLQGILDGLNNEKKIDASAKSLVDALKKAIQKAAEIHSPSRLFKREVGFQVPAGIVEGIEEKTANVNQAGSEMIQKLIEGQKEKLKQQQAALKEYSEDIGSSTSVTELNRLTTVAPVQQVTATVDNTAMLGMCGEIIGMMREYMPQLANMQLVTDTGALVGATNAQMSEAFAMANIRRRR